MSCFGQLGLPCETCYGKNRASNQQPSWCCTPGCQRPPRDQADPNRVLKYLARYMTGGPISDQRLISHDDGQVTFWARSKDKKAGNPSRPFPLSGIEFTRRWALHILPKGFTKVRRYGGYSGRLCRDYLDRCRGLLGITDQASQDAASDEVLPPSSPNCP